MLLDVDIEWLFYLEDLMTYKEIFTFQNLYLAHKKARKSKRHKKDVILFEIDLSNNLYELYKQLNGYTYQISGYHKFLIFEPKEREIQALEYKDRVVQHCLCDNYLMPLLERRLIFDNGACRKGKGTDFSRNRIKGFLRDYFKHHGHTGYYLKCDIKKYFNSISHSHLKNILNKEISQKDIKELLFSIIDSYEYKPGYGIPMGNQTSQCFALLYLDKIDRVIKEKFQIKYYSRYMDDLILIYPSKDYLIEVLKYLDDNLRESFELEFNNKTKIGRIENGITYLGARFYLTSTKKVIMKIDNNKRTNLITKINKKNRNKKNIGSYLGYLKKFNEYKMVRNLFNLKKINKWEVLRK